MKLNTRSRLLALGLLLAALGGSWSGGPTQATPAAPALPSLQGEAARAYLTAQGLSDDLQVAFSRARYGAHSNVEADGGYFANNPAQAYQAGFGPRGLTLSAAEESGRQWRLGLELTGIGYGARQLSVSAGRLQVAGERVALTRQVAGQAAPLTEWFVNRATGLEHGFTLSAPPGQPQADERLRLRLRARGDLRAEADGQGLRWLEAAGGVALRSEHLAVTDATGRRLAAQLTAAGAEVGVEVADAGAVYPLTIDPIFFVQQAYLKASNTGSFDVFGWAVAISGNTIVVGAPGEASNAIGVNGDQANNLADAAGATYVFVRSGGLWTQQAYLKASNTESSDLFGLAVAISGDTIVVGAFSEDSNATGVNGDGANNAAPNAGAAYVFVRNGGAWTQQAYLKASNTERGDRFGGAVAISDDTIVVGVPGEASNATGVNGDQANNLARAAGATYVFVRSGAAWTQQAYLKASNTESFDGFGIAMAISGDTIVVGAPFEDSNATGVNGDGANNAASAAGAAYVFVRSGGAWMQQAYLKASNTGGGDQFGWAVAISDDTIVVGVPFEDSNATGVNGNQANNAAESAGAAYVFARVNELTISKSFTPATINVGASTRLTLTFINPAGNSALTNLAVTDNLPSGMTVAATPGLVNTCGGTVTGATAGSTSFSLSGGTLAAGASCQVQVNVTSITLGSITNTTTAPTATGGSSNVTGTPASAQLTVNAVFGRPVITIVDPLGCTGPGDILTVTVTLTNPIPFVQPVTFTSMLPPGLIGVPGSGTSTVGAPPVVTATSASYMAILASGRPATVTYQVQVGDAAAGTQLCVNLATAFSGATVGPTVQACATIDCPPPVGPGAVFPTTSEVSDQQAGSVLVYNLYSSSAAALQTQNTRLSLTNTNPASDIAVHLFFVDGQTCSIADAIICLTKNQTASFLASDLDPGTTGYAVAVASDLATGCPVNFNFLIGDAYVKLASGHAANLGAEAFAALAGASVACAGNAVTAQLNFDGISYNRAPRTLAASGIPARPDGNDTLLVVNRFGGNLTTGAATLNDLFGIFYDDAENGLSFTFSPGTCQFRSSLSNTFLRLPRRFENVVPAGRSGWLRLYSTSDIGLLGALLNFNPNAATDAGAFNQGRNLHKLTLTSTQTLIIPIFPPNCLD